MSETPRTPLRSLDVVPTVTLGILGGATLLLYRIAVHISAVANVASFLKLLLVQLVIYFAVVWISLRARESTVLLLLGLAFAALFRLSILFSPPFLSDDIYRYVWDGRVQAAAINPYRYIPADESLSQLRDDKIYPHINRREYARTMYPPVAEGAFLLITRVSESVTWMKTAMVGAEVITVWAIIQLLTLAGFARQRVLIYAWHPLVVWEFAGSGHLDALAVAFIAVALLARRKGSETLTGVLLACATCVKFFPVVLFPVCYRRWGWKMPLAFAATIIAAYLPYLSVGPLGTLGFLPGYASERGIVTGEQFFLLTFARRMFGANVPVLVYLVLSTVVLGLLPVWLAWRERIGDEQKYLRNCLVVSSAFMVLLSPHFSWYFCWLVPFLCFVPSLPVFYLTAASFLLYLTWMSDTVERIFELKALIFVPFLVLGAAVLWAHRKANDKLESVSEV